MPVIVQQGAGAYAGRMREALTKLLLMLAVLAMPFGMAAPAAAAAHHAMPVAAMPKRIIFRSRSFMTFADRPGQARRSALGRVHPSARSPRRRTDHLQPMMLSTMAATGMALQSSFTEGPLPEEPF